MIDAFICFGLVSSGLLVLVCLGYAIDIWSGALPKIIVKEDKKTKILARFLIAINIAE